LLIVEIEIKDRKTTKSPWEEIVQFNCDTKDVVVMTLQTDLSSHTASELKLPDGEGKQLRHSRLEKMG
jgi:hypothetical protein